MGEVEKKVNFTITHRLTLLSMIQNNADEKYWGGEGMKIRKELIAELSVA